MCALAASGHGRQVAGAVLAVELVVPKTRYLVPYRVRGDVIEVLECFTPRAAYPIAGDVGPALQHLPAPSAAPASVQIKPSMY